MIKKKVYNLKAPSEELLIDRYLMLFGFGMKLTKKEFELVSFMLSIYLDIYDDVLDHDAINSELFSREGIKDIKTTLGISDASWSLMRKSLLSKRALTDNDGSIGLNKLLIPAESVTFNFNTNA
tara:strand:- start:105 stop:476 length:372 start_codon:yes stop_codon:yes gene_type:complete